MERFQPSYAVHREDACHSKLCGMLAKTLGVHVPRDHGKQEVFTRVARGAILAERRVSDKANRRPPETAVALKWFG